jgi:hypothetical protein
MKKEVKNSQAELKDREYYQSFTPNERVEKLLEIIDLYRPRNPDGTPEEFKRVCRIVKRSQLED